MTLWSEDITFNCKIKQMCMKYYGCQYSICEELKVWVSHKCFPDENKNDLKMFI